MLVHLTLDLDWFLNLRVNKDVFVTNLFFIYCHLAHAVRELICLGLSFLYSNIYYATQLDIDLWFYLNPY